MPFAESDTATTATASVLITAAVGAIVAGVISVVKNWRDGRKEGRVDALAEWAKIHELDRATNSQLTKQVADLQEKLALEIRRSSMMESELMYMRSWCEANGMPVKPWTIPPAPEIGSKLHVIPEEVR